MSSSTSNYLTLKERDSIDILTKRKIAVQVKLQHFQRALRALRVIVRIADVGQADVNGNDLSGGPIDQTLIRMRNGAQQSIVALLKSSDRCRSEIADCNAKIADVQRKAYFKAAEKDDFGYEYDDLNDQDVRNFIALVDNQIASDDFTHILDGLD